MAATMPRLDDIIGGVESKYTASRESHSEVTTVGTDELGIVVDAASFLQNLRKQLVATPPDGWVTFGSHVDQPDIRLEFWGSDLDLMPVLERAAPAVEPTEAIIR